MVAYAILCLSEDLICSTKAENYDTQYVSFATLSAAKIQRCLVSEEHEGMLERARDLAVFGERACRVYDRVFLERIHRKNPWQLEQLTIPPTLEEYKSLKISERIH
eukprot:TRINITY_DN422_c0_g1_i2.p1 TRINITY_DN422_c0_g1~~TRINITY_DN422_c0_g1_i2.p1  ORF type:complete len:106 (+),score=8.48 TRINITY_DN422_c0_g1_i2:523-840(+)